MSALANVTVIAIGDAPERGARQNRAERIAALLDDAFLTEMGFDFDGCVLTPPENHRLIIRPVCKVAGCSTTATVAGKICGSCQRRLEAAGLGDDQVGLLAPPPRASRSPGKCGVGGCQREQAPGAAGLCGAHLDQQQALGVAAADFLMRPDVLALASTGPCAVPACSRQRRHP
ncbi:MAG: hypothetical protein ACRETZ_16445, partial [Steroidobacteraceae bacterium]